jgi:hypothetical protein
LHHRRSQRVDCSLLLGSGLLLVLCGSSRLLLLLSGGSGLLLLLSGLSRGSLLLVLCGLGRCGLLLLLGGGSGLLLLLSGGGDLTSKLLELLGNTLLLAGGVLCATSVSLLSELLLTDLLLLHLVNGLDEHSLVLVEVTLGSKIELMVDVLGDLLGIAILAEEASEDSLASHPQDLLWHTGILGTLSLTGAGVATLALGLVEGLHSGARVHVDLASHDETVLEQLADVLSRVCKGDLSDFIGIDPNTLDTDLENVGCESLLELQGCHI